MSTEFGRSTFVVALCRLPKLVAGLRLQGRAADGVDYTGTIAWRGSQAAFRRRPALEGLP